jgi:hypothetical protein
METLVCFKNDIKPIFATATLSFKDSVRFISENSLRAPDSDFDQLLGMDLQKDGFLPINSEKVLTRGAGVYWFDNIVYHLMRDQPNFSNHIIAMIDHVRRHWKQDSPELCVKVLGILLKEGVKALSEESNPIVMEFKRRAREVTEELNALKRFATTTIVDGMMVMDVSSPYNVQEDMAHFLSFKNPGRKIVVNNFGIDPVRTVIVDGSGVKEEEWVSEKLTKWC